LKIENSFLNAKGAKSFRKGRKGNNIGNFATVAVSLRLKNIFSVDATYDLF
jgi:hypothetical protein